MQAISELAESTLKELSGVENWKAFLNSAAWQYKYSFEDQVLIYAQRPDARACADFDTWSQKLKRRINRGAKGIALLRERGNQFYLDHVFDVSDTNRGINGVDIKLWQYDNKYFDAVKETLENRFGEFWYPSLDVADSVICTARNIVSDGKADYLSDLEYVKTDSFLEEYDDLNLDKKFQELAENSVAYMTMVRLGVDAENYFTFEDFMQIADYNTVESISVLGNAVSSFSEEILREINSTIVAEINSERQNSEKFAENKVTDYNVVEEKTMEIKTEGVEEYDRDNLQERERDSDSEFGSTEERTDHRQIRNDEEEISEAEPTEPLLDDDAERDTDGASVRNRPNSERTGGTDDTENGEIGGRGREAQSRESSEVDRSDEQFQTFRRRGSIETTGSQLSLFDLDYSSDIQSDMQREAERLNNIRPAFSIPQQVIDTVLCDGTHHKESIITIVSEFSKDKSLEDKVTFLKDHYKTDGKGFVLDGKQISTWWNNEGITISYGNTVETGNKQHLSWEDAARRIDELLDMGRFASTDILLQVDDYIYTKTAEKFLFIYRDLNYDDYPELFSMFADEAFEQHGGFPETAKRIKVFLKTSAGLDVTKTAVQKLCDLYDEHKDVVRFKYIALILCQQRKVNELTCLKDSLELKNTQMK